MIVIGLDLSLTSTGLAVVDTTAVEPTRVKRIQSKGHAGATLLERTTRLDGLLDEVCAAIDGSDLVVLEGPAFSRSNPGMHDRSGFWWLVTFACHAAAIALVEVAPSARAKYATGKGNAGKDQVLAAVVRRYPNVEVTGNDEADALVLAAMGARAVGRPIDDLPQAHLTGMSKVAWPKAATA